MIGGIFIQCDDKGNIIAENPNTLVGEGFALWLRTIFRAEAVLAANFYLGLTNAAIGYGDSLATAAAGEPSGNGYARQALTRGTGAWTVEQVNGLYRARSSLVTFTASANYDKTYTRMFLCDVSAGTGGKLHAASGPTPNPIQVLSGAGPANLGYIFTGQ
jgi:hypothetical protein